MITPADIDKKKFGTTRLKEGYDQDEVDAFLDAVAEEYGQVLTRLARFESDNEILRRKLENASADAVTAVIPASPSVGASRLLVAAQETADRVEAEANAEAGRIRAAARTEADNIRAVAEADRQRTLNKLATEQAELEERIEALKAKRSNYKSWLRAALNKLEEEEANDA